MAQAHLFLLIDNIVHNVIHCAAFKRNPFVEDSMDGISLFIVCYAVEEISRMAWNYRIEIESAASSARRDLLR
jgi:hypothetical protein